MQEHGVSKIVSVKFHKADEAAGGPTPLSMESLESTNGNGLLAEAEEEKTGGAGETNDVVLAK
jgi:hypothetical protein